MHYTPLNLHISLDDTNSNHMQNVFSNLTQFMFTYKNLHPHIISFFFSHSLQPESVDIYLGYKFKIVKYQRLLRNQNIWIRLYYFGYFNDF